MNPHLNPSDLADKVIDAHSHVGLSLKAYICLEFPYCQSVEGLYYKQRVNGVDVNIVFPYGEDLYFDLHELTVGNAVPAARPFSSVPYEIENEVLLREIFDWCPERKEHFLPFVMADASRDAEGQVAVLERLEATYPFYGIKISPVSSQLPITGLLDVGRPLVEYARSRNIPFLIHTTVDPRETYSHARLVFEVVEANPDVRFCMAHCIGCQRSYLDRAAALDNVWVDTSALKIQVDLVAQGSTLMAPPDDRLDADFNDHRDVMLRLVERYPEMILWGSDAPAYAFIMRRRQGEGDDDFEDFRLKGTHEDEVAALNALPDDLRRKVSNDNIVKYLFG